MPVEVSSAFPDTRVENRPAIAIRQRLIAHLRIARLDHSVKQVFILPGIVLAMALINCWTRHSTGCTPSRKTGPQPVA